MKKKILFVDDEANILDGLRRTLRDMRREWEMEFAAGGRQAIEILSSRTIDVLVTDMRMPGMDGRQLLEKVKQSYPLIVRIILSGHSDKNVIFSSVGLAHQFLSKPCDSETLRATVARACAMRELLEDQHLIEVVSSIDALPSLPSVYKEVVEEINSEEGSLEKIGEIISRDAGMSAKLLQLASSAFFGLPQRSKSIARVVNLLGIETIKTLILSVNIFAQYERAGLASISKLWDHSLGVGMIAKSIAKSEKLDHEEAFLAGLLHDLGKLILLDKFPGKCEETINLSNTSGCPIWEAEQTVLGTTHAHIGAYLMGIWGLSGTLVEAIAFHHCPHKCSNSAFGTLSMVHLADWAEHSGRAEGGNYGLDKEYLDKLGISEKLCERFLTEPNST
jgi:putative nucleotidyltransferase with HDIG domain